MGQNQGDLGRVRDLHSGQFDRRIIGPCFVRSFDSSRDSLLGAGRARGRLDRNCAGDAGLTGSANSTLAVCGARLGGLETFERSYSSAAPQMSSAASKGIVSSWWPVIANPRPAPSAVGRRTTFVSGRYD